MKTNMTHHSTTIRCYAGVLSILCCLLFIGCDKAPPNAEAKIGVIAPLTGPAASYGESAKNACELAATDFFRDHPEAKATIKIEYQDDKANPKDAMSAYQQLRAGGTAVFVGPMTSGSALAVSESAKNDPILMLLPTATNPQLRGKSANIFRTCVSDDAEGAAVAEFVRKHAPYAKVFALHINNEYGLGVVKSFSQSFTAQGGTFVSAESYDPTASDFRSVCAKVASSPATAVFLVGQKEQAQVLKQLREAGFSGQFYGTTMFDDPLVMTSPAANGAIFSMRKIEDGSFGGNANPFFPGYKSTYNKPADYYAASFYDGMTIALRAAQAISEKGGKIENLSALPRTVAPKMGATGPLDFDQQNDVVQPFGFRQVAAGQGKALSLP